MIENNNPRHRGIKTVNVEPLYEPTGREPQPPPVGDENGRVVFSYSPSSVVNYVSTWGASELGLFGSFIETNSPIIISIKMKM